MVYGKLYVHMCILIAKLTACVHYHMHAKTHILHWAGTELRILRTYANVRPCMRVMQRFQYNLQISYLPCGYHANVRESICIFGLDVNLCVCGFSYDRCEDAAREFAIK